MSIQDPTDRQPSATPGERPRDERGVCPQCSGEGIVYLGEDGDDSEECEACEGTGRNTIALLRAQLAAAPARLGEPDNIEKVREFYQGLIADRDEEIAALQAAVSPPLRDESVPPPGWEPSRHIDGLFSKVSGYVSWPLTAAWAQYDSEHGYAPAAPSTREGPGEVERLRLDNTTYHSAVGMLQAQVERLRDALRSIRRDSAPGETDDTCDECQGRVGPRGNARSYACRMCVLREYIDAALGSTGGADPRGHFLRELASEFFHGTTFDDLIAASPNKPASVVIADELYRRAAAFGGVAGR